MRRVIVPLALVYALGVCATVPITVNCDRFRTDYVHPVPRSKVIEAIQSDVPAPVSTSAPDHQVFTSETLDTVLQQTDLAARIAEKAGSEEAGLRSLNASHPPTALLLSGGGQWGAFGAAYLRALEEKSPDTLPRFTLITGVSTGALQALFVGGNQARGPGRESYLKALTRNYAPARESDMVRRGNYVTALFGGSVAKLGPLRSRIENAMCPPQPGAQRS